MKLPTFTRKTQQAAPVRMFDERAPITHDAGQYAGGIVGRADIRFISRLPAEAQPLLRQVADEWDDLNALSHALGAKLRDVVDAKGNAQSRISQLESPANSFSKLSGPEIERQRKIVEECKSDIERLNVRLSDIGTKSRSLSALIEGARDLVRRTEHKKPILAYSGPAPQLRKNETPAEAVEARRRRLRELIADYARTEAAPKRSADVKAAEIERIEVLAKQGAPNAFSAIERGEAVTWPTTNIELNGEFVAVTDFMAIMAHLHRDAMIAAVTREIDLMSDDENALSDVDRQQQLSEIKRDQLTVERDEVAFVRMANSQGASILFRGDTDPRALLGLADDAPAPRHHD